MNSNNTNNSDLKCNKSDLNVKCNVNAMSDLKNNNKTVNDCSEKCTKVDVSTCDYDGPPDGK